MDCETLKLAAQERAVFCCGEGGARDTVRTTNPEPQTLHLAVLQLLPVFAVCTPSI